ncbi:DUF192 domain-containing protein [Rhodobacter capsulatus]|uniref:DUF192 domain-containing protein n=1 Tax=Rhodobacter capsulatus TaxID=1061 RepID=UPI0009B89BEB|nr:DUF192 domain-containing protein [Rhodobacter capsulatus]MDS0927889.1 DUF192 domain-containing protein [Rhodobacter capsulatus]
MSAGDRGAARPDGGADHKLGSGAARALRRGLGLTALALWAGAASGADCDRPGLAAALQEQGPAVLCIAGAKGPVRLSVEIADTEAERERGLMGRRDLPPGTGMIFIYPTPRRVAFWMHDTPLPLDMLFIEAGGRIETLHENARPFDDTPIWSAGPVRYVLEIAGGQAAALGLRPGQRVLPLD